MEDLQETNLTPVGLVVRVTPSTFPEEAVEAVEVVEEAEETPMTKTMDQS